MNTKRIINKTLTISATSLLVAGFVVLFVSAAKVKEQERCKALVIQIAGSEKPFVDVDGIQSMISSHPALNPVGKSLHAIHLNQIETLIRSKPWIAKAYCFMDNQGTLQIRILQHQPLARVFTISGTSFYIDTAGQRLPVTGRFYTKVPVVTGFPDTLKNFSTIDSGLFAQTVKLSQYISTHTFWMSQIAQININSAHEFELIPEVGEQMIEFGNGLNMDSKFDNLYSFYKHVLNSKGWNHYDTIDVRFSHEVLGIGKQTTKGSPRIQIPQDSKKMETNLNVKGTNSAAMHAEKQAVESQKISQNQ